MDPLSISASVIALFQIPVALGKGAQLLATLRHAPADFCDLVNELNTLQAVIKQVRSLLEELTNEQTSNTAFTPVDTSTAVALELELRFIVEELQALCDRLTATDKADEKDRPRQVSKRRWIREQSNITKLKSRVNTTRNYLMLCFGAIVSSQSLRQGRLMVETHQLVQGLPRTFERKTERIRDTLVAGHANIDNMVATLDGQIRAQASDLEQLLTAKCQPPNQSNLLKLDRPNAEADPYVSVEVSVHRNCLSCCRCQCHQHHRMQSPAWMRSVFGTLFLQYNSVPLLRPQKCDLGECRASSPASSRLIYLFPKWFLSRAVFLATSWSSLTGTGASIHLHVPRLVPRDQMVSVVYNCDIAWIKRGITNSTVLPTDVDEDGNSLLMLSLRDVNLPLSEFLVQQGWPLHLENVTGWTASSRSRLLYYATKHERIQSLKPEHRRMIEHLTFSQGGSGSTSTLIHDAVLGVTSMSVLDAITRARSDIDSLDSYGWCPLHWAIYLDDYKSLEVLLYRGASPKTVTRSGWTPLHYAARYEPPGSVRMAQAVIEAGADINAQVRNYRGFKGETAIIFAFDNPEMVKLLLEHSSVIVVKTDINWVCPLSYRARRTSNVDRHDPRRWHWDRSLDLLISAGMDLDLPSQQTGYEGRTPLHDTILWRNAALLELLIQHGARLDAMDKYGSGVLHFAAQSANLELINVLRDAQICGLNTDQTNAAGDTPMRIMTARMYGAEERRQPGETRPTYEEWLAFKQLLLEIRGRTCGHFSTDHTGTVFLGRYSHNAQSDVEDITSMGVSEDDHSDEDEFFDTSEGLQS